MATNVTIPEGFRIVNQTPQIPEGFRIVSNEPKLNLTEEQKAQIKANRDDYERKQAERDKDQWFVSLVENKQDDPLKNIARSTARLGLSTMQGIANAGLNPFTGVAEEMGADLKPIKPENMAERTAELAGEYGYDAAALYALGKGVGGLYPKLSPYTAPLTLGGFPVAMSQTLGSSLATGTIDPQSTVGRIATDIIGGGLGSGLARPRVSMPKETKAISELEKTVGKDVLAENVAEAERTGRNLLEVGSDEITQRALQAKLQTPEARKILLDSIEQSSAAQPARTKAVINEALGTEGKNSTLSQVMENAKAEAQPIYKELEDIGDLAAYETKDIPEQNFKRWFEGSQVVDENGQPLKLYHGTNANFDKFDKEMIGKGTDAGFFGKGFYVTPNKGEAGTYGKNVMPLYTNAKNLYNLNGVDGGKSSGIRNMFEKGAKLFRDLDLLDEKDLRKLNFYENAQNDFLNNIEVFPPNEYTNVWFGEVTTPNGEKILERAWDSNNTKEGLLDVLWNKYSRRIKYEDGTYLDRLLDGLSFKDYMRSDSSIPEKFSNKIKSLGYDGINQGDEIVLFEPNQIKSVNNSGAWSSSPSLSDAGWKPESQLANAIKNNDVLADTISRVKRANSSLKNLSDTDFRVVNEARTALSKASLNPTDLSGHEARMALKELDPILNRIIPTYKEARGIYENAHQFERAADLGRDVFNSRVSPDDMKVKIGALTANEKKAARIGLREEILNKIGSTNNQTNALNKLLPENVREKITTLAGEKEGAKIIDEAEQAVKLRNNLNKVFSGSQTAEKGVLERAIAGVMNFKSHPVLSTLGSIYTPYNRGINIRAAETLTDKNIADAYRNVMNARNAPKQPKGYAQSGLRSIIERLTEENN